MEFPSRSRGKTGKAKTQVTRLHLTEDKTDVAPVSYSAIQSKSVRPVRKITLSLPVAAIRSMCTKAANDDNLNDRTYASGRANCIGAWG